MKEPGGLVGWNYSGSIDTSYSTATVNGAEDIGGLVGFNNGAGGITNCYSTGTVSGRAYVGGLVGENGGAVTDCYSTGTVSGQSYVGGLIGGAHGYWEMPSVIRCCYSTGAVSGKEYVGGLVGINRNWAEGWYASHRISNCYSASPVTGTDSVGGLVGLGSPDDVTACFWDVQTSGQATSAGGTGKTTTEMYDPNTFRAEGWDFVGQVDGPHDVWAEAEGGGYPILYWQLPSGLGLPRFSGGTGEPNDPYIISTPQELNSVGHNPRLITCHFKLVHDLDMIGCAFYPIGDHDYPYAGVFDGNGHTVSHLTITGESHVGLFGLLESGAEVKDLGVVDVNITASEGYVGGLVGLNWGGVTDCYSTGSVSGTSYVGGLVGRNSGDVTYSYSNGSVSGDSDVGGLVGYNQGSITTSYSTGSVSGTGNYVGGLVGFSGEEGNLIQCYSTGAVTGIHQVGGLVGSNSYGNVINCYSTGAVSGGDQIGGLVGDSFRGPVTHSFWDTQTSGQTRSNGGTGKTTAEMQVAKTFLDAGWDFVGETANGTEDIWWILEGKDYPRLWWQAK